jgi:hypothetical protein
MGLATVLAFLALVCALVAMGFVIRIANDLRARGLDAHPVRARWMLFSYMSEYRRMTVEETGHAGPLYAVCSTMGALAAVFAIAAILVAVF